jgi:hypothetical protein
MSISHSVPGASPAQVVADAVDSVRELTDLLWSAQTDSELVAVVEQVQVLRSVLTAFEASAVVEVDVRDLPKSALRYGSTGDWLTHVGGLRRGEGKRRLVRAKALTGPLGRTHQALVQGTVSPEQADVVVGAVEALPSGALARARGEKALVSEAGRLDASELARAGRHLVDVVDPAGEDRRLERQLERDERASHAGRFLAITEDGAGGVWVKGRGSIEDGALLKAALMPLTCPNPAADDETGEPAHDPRDYGARLWDALVQTAQHALDTELPPETHTTTARLLVTVDHDTLIAGLAANGIATTQDGIELPPAVVRRLACDAEIIPAVLGGHGEVLDVGRLKRLVTAVIWRALVIRDRHCTFPGCTRPPIMCHAHHIIHWLNGGKTKLDNLALLCGHHHRVIHNTPWEIRLNQADRKPEFFPPPRRGRPNMPVRNRPRHA